MFMVWRGALFAAPVALIYVFVATAHPWSALLTAAEVLGLVTAGGALSGLGYGLVGRHLRDSFPGSSYLVGILTVAPYMCLMPYVMNVTDGVSLTRPIDMDSVVVCAVLTLVFGCAMGYGWFDRPHR
jgi:hypothetical protein